ncbi:MAG: MFS transporter [Acidimicrobiaceae bacterium]|nr:MFS transporter [Acidimicrobiaceae bacterium]
MTTTFLSTRRGQLTLLFLCGVAFLDFVDASIVNVALPSIRSDLHFSVQNLQWVLSAYLLTYGGFLLLGGRMADLLGRRRVLVTGITLFGSASLLGGLSPTSGVLVGARLAQGVGAAMMLPAALSILTTTFNEGTDRIKAISTWGAVAALASAVGVFLGGVLSSTLGWRWVMFVNLPVCVLDLFAAFRLVSPERRHAPLKHFDTRGAALMTGGMLLLVYTLVRAPEVGWNDWRTIGGLAASAVLLGAFVRNELRHPNPIAPLSIFRINGLAAANATQLTALAGFYAMFFFVTLYMQNVLGFSPIRAGAAYLPVTVGVAVTSGVTSKLFPRIGTRPIIMAGGLIASAAVFLLSRLPVHGSYLTDLLPALVIMSVGLGAVFVGVTTAANAGVPADKAGLAAGLVNTSQWLGAALGLAVLTAISTARTNHLAAIHASRAYALTQGFRLALLCCSIFLLAAALIAVRATNTRGEPELLPELAGVSA